MPLSHLSESNQPDMVDVGKKDVTQRTARAQATLRFPPGILDQLEAPDNEERISPKGPVFETAIIAGIMAAKRTGELIPLCHIIPLDKCGVQIAVTAPDTVTVECTARATHKTGVEMEALTGATLAALTIYDMCKALSHHIVIENVRLLEKTGGKSDIHDQG